MANPSTDNEFTSELLIEPAKLKQLIDKSDDLTMLPAVAMKAIEMANDPECSIPEFVDVIEKDTRLVADILSLSNSAMYQSSREIEGIQHAVVVVGCRQCQNLIVSSSMKSLMKKLPPAVEWARDVLWRHSVQTATIARRLNQIMQLEFDGEEFSGAMIHDVGRLLIAAAAPDVFEIVDRLSFSEGSGILENEQELIGTDHCEIGAQFAETGQLPTSLVDVIRFHHTPKIATSNERLVALVSSADHMANHLTHMGSVDGYELDSNPGFEMLLAEARDNAKRATIDLVQATMQAAEDAIEGMSKSGINL